MKSAIKLADAVSKNYNILSPHGSIWSFMKKHAGEILVCRSCHDVINELYAEMNSEVIIPNIARPKKFIRAWAELDRRNERLRQGLPAE